MNRIQRLGVPRLARGRARPARSRGQSLVEFALVFPIFFTLFIGDHRVRPRLQRPAGGQLRDPRGGARRRRGRQRRRRRLRDPPQRSRTRIVRAADDDKITEVVIYRSDTVGNPVPIGAPQQNVYHRGGTSSARARAIRPRRSAFSPCRSRRLSGGDRCNTIAGCGAGRPLDHIGVAAHVRRTRGTRRWRRSSGWAGPATSWSSRTRCGWSRPVRRLPVSGVCPRARPRRAKRTRPEPRRVRDPRPGLHDAPARHARVRLRVPPPPRPRVRDPRRAPGWRRRLGSGTDQVACADVDENVIAALQRVVTSPGSQIKLGEHQRDPDLRRRRERRAGRHARQRLDARARGPIVDGYAPQVQPSTSVGWNACARKNAGRRRTTRPIRSASA